MTPPKHGIARRPIRFLVMAGNFQEYRNWVLSSNAEAGETLYIINPEKLRDRGLRASPETPITLVLVGTFHLRPDSKDIIKEAQQCFPDSEWIRADTD